MPQGPTALHELGAGSSGGSLGSPEAPWDHPGPIPSPQSGAGQPGGTRAAPDSGVGTCWEWTKNGPACGELETRPATAMLGQGLLALGLKLGPGPQAVGGHGAVGSAVPSGPRLKSSPDHSHRASSEERQHLREHNACMKLRATSLFAKH